MFKELVVLATLVAMLGGCVSNPPKPSEPHKRKVFAVTRSHPAPVSATSRYYFQNRGVGEGTAPFICPGTGEIGVLISTDEDRERGHVHRMFRCDYER